MRNLRNYLRCFREAGTALSHRVHLSCIIIDLPSHRVKCCRLMPVGSASDPPVFWCLRLSFGNTAPSGNIWIPISTLGTLHCQTEGCQCSIPLFSRSSPLIFEFATGCPSRPDRRHVSQATEPRSRARGAEPADHQEPLEVGAKQDMRRL